MADTVSAVSGSALFALAVAVVTTKAAFLPAGMAGRQAGPPAIFRALRKNRAG